MKKLELSEITIDGLIGNDSLETISPDQKTALEEWQDDFDILICGHKHKEEVK